MKYFIEIGTINKAKRDIEIIAGSLGYKNLTRINFGNGGVARFLTKLVSVSSIVFRLHRGDMLLLQYPMKKFFRIASLLAHLNGAAVVTVIHDLGAFRRHKLTPEKENRRLSAVDVLIVHNATMKQYLIENGFKGRIQCLEIFDFLSDNTPAQATLPAAHPWRIAYAGNLGRRRNDFLYKLDDVTREWTLDLYGKGFAPEECSNPNLHYHGFMPSEDFITKVQAHFGIVWDGDSTDECTGAWGEYLKINDPHKTSFYLRAGIPVIVWSKAAMAQFITKENVGIAVNSLKDIAGMLASLTGERYDAMRRAAAEMSVRLGNGHYITSMLSEAEEYLGLSDKH